MFRHIFRFELQRIAAACDKVGLYETWSDICDGDREMTHPCLLRQAFQIMVLESLGGRVGWGGTETLVPAMEVMQAMRALELFNDDE